jgi:hypothetical protein
MAEEKDKEDHMPRWEMIEKLHDKIDGDINDAYDTDKLSFIEVDFALLMIKEKIYQQKMEMYNLYFKAKEEEEGETKDAPDHMFK